ncbi:bifunctional UDP-4-keto-pentose/UDP-xylose synthase [Piscirickettsia salmonis]|uniref:bifunctional UDP-4-keto-pentose/UDP-xylose synthase n=1 Tax=Piscirickettsia salmonis TaxID=1238 RepID=UPI0007C957B1|nr:Bifunctional polymyxin resistance protein ArnA [Piscirickettsiaceae bacterium NZ-RLO1]
MSTKVLILGVNGFIGSSLSEYILEHTDWEVYGLDLSHHKLDQCIGHQRFHFTEGDMLIHKEWVEYHVKKCDVVLPLVAIATPATYVKDPLRIFELDFEANLEVVRWCAKYNKHVVFPSTSEVYGMCEDDAFDEENSHFINGPINKPRWIYSNSKQLMDRVIHAMGEKEGLNYTLFRPFNWIGGRQDEVFNIKEGGARVLTQFISNIIHGRDIQLVDGGEQRRCFTYIDDGIEALARIIECRDSSANRQIINIGNPGNNHSIKELAEVLLAEIKKYDQYQAQADKVRVTITQSDRYYGEGYQDVKARIPAIDNAKKYLNWQPKTDFVTAIQKTLAYHLA